MIEILSEFIVKDGADGLFELAFGPGGAWGQTFARQPGFRGLTILRDAANPRRYLAVEVWDTVALRQQAMAERGAEYADLEAQLGEWVDARTEFGVFKLLAEAAVRPRLSAERAKGRNLARTK